jgi:hypothetical protein
MQMRKKEKEKTSHEISHPYKNPAKYWKKGTMPIMRNEVKIRVEAASDSYT